MRVNPKPNTVRNKNNLKNYRNDAISRRRYKVHHKSDALKLKKKF